MILLQADALVCKTTINNLVKLLGKDNEESRPLKRSFKQKDGAEPSSSSSKKSKKKLKTSDSNDSCKLYFRTLVVINLLRQLLFDKLNAL